jgi:hypothetical protein
MIEFTREQDQAAERLALEYASVGCAPHEQDATVMVATATCAPEVSGFTTLAPVVDTYLVAEDGDTFQVTGHRLCPLRRVA